MSTFSGDISQNMCSDNFSGYERTSNLEAANIYPHVFEANETAREFGREIPQSQIADQPRNREKEPQNTNSHKTDKNKTIEVKQLALYCPPS